MKALNWSGERQLEIMTLSIPEVGAKDVLIEVQATGICGSDLHAYLGKHRFRNPPAVLGHEVVGRVKEKGSGVTKIDVGDLVTVMPLIACGTCVQCQANRPHLCLNKIVPGTSKWTGTFAEYFVAPEDVTVKLPEDFPLKVGALIEPIAVAVHAAKQAGSVQGRTAHIIGAGPIGHLIAITAQTMGAQEITCIDPDPAALQAAADNGFKAVRPGETTGLPEADTTFVTANYDASIDDAMKLTKPAGTSIVVAMYEGHIPIDIYQLVFDEITLRGSMIYRLEDFYAAVDVAQVSREKLLRIVSPLMPFEEGPGVFEALARGERTTLKTLLAPAT